MKHQRACNLDHLCAISGADSVLPAFQVWLQLYNINAGQRCPSRVNQAGAILAPLQSNRSIQLTGFESTIMSYADDSDASSTDAEELHDQTTEVGMDRWLRLPGETDFFKGEGRPDTKFLALGDAKLPVFDEITAWMKRANKPPQEEIFRGRIGFHPEDAERNYMVAEKRYNMDIPLNGIENDVRDREFYDRWSETLDFR